MAEKSVPDISPLETGELGVRHLKRYWAKRLLEIGNRLDREGVRSEEGLDFTLMQGLGLGIVEPLECLFQCRPEFGAFERWIVGKLGGAPAPALVERLNRMVECHLEKPRREYPLADEKTEDPVLSEDDLLFWHEHGYAVVRNAVDIDDCREAEAAVFDTSDTTRA